MVARGFRRAVGVFTGLALASVGMPDSVVYAVESIATTVPVIEVANLNDSGPGSLRAAVASASNTAGHNTITFAAGLSGTIHLTSGEIRADRANFTLDGPGSDQIVVDAGGSSRALALLGPGNIADTGGSIIVRGLTLTNGSSRVTDDGGDRFEPGGALNVSSGSASVDLDDVVVTNSHGGPGGGASIWGRNTVTITDSTFSDNEADDLTQQGDVVVGGASGGGLWVQSSSVSLNGVTVANNTGFGAAFLRADHVVVTGSDFLANTGTGLRVRALDAVVRSSNIRGNHSTAAASAAEFSDNADETSGSRVLIDGTEISENVSTQGSTVLVYDGLLAALRNVTLAGNDSGSASVLRFDGYDPVISNSTIANNVTSVGAIRAADSVSIRSSILAGNSGGDLGVVGANNGGQSAAFHLDYVLAQSPRSALRDEVTAGSNITGADPHLGSLSSNGGHGRTMLPLAGSPAIDRGKTFGANPDGTGRPRPVDDVSIENAADAADMGAAEVQSGTQPPAALVPQAVTNLDANRADASATLTWTQPSSDGGSPITGYRVLAKLRGAPDSDFATVLTTGPSSAGALVAGLLNDTTYTLKVQPVNAVGDGPMSDAVDVTPTRNWPPVAPQLVDVRSGPGSVVVSWHEPSPTFVSDVTSFVVQTRPTNGSPWSDAATVTAPDGGFAANNATVVSGLTNGIAYDVRVIAANLHGDSEPSNVRSVTPAEAGSTISSAPTITDLRRPTYDDNLGEGGDLTVEFTAPADFGGSALAAFEVDYKEHSGTDWKIGKISGAPGGIGQGASTWSVLVGLTDGTDYDFRVRALNGKGWSSWSASKSVVVGVPPAPSLDGLSSANGSLLALWSGGGGIAPVIGYVVQVKPTSQGTWPEGQTYAPDRVGALLEGLTNETSYDVRVQTINRFGSSAWSVGTATPHAPSAGVASAPTLDSVQPVRDGGTTAVDVGWTGGSWSSDDPPLGYRIEYRPTVGPTWTVGAVTSASDAHVRLTGMTVGSSYIVRVLTINGAGLSTSSNAMTFTFATTPAEPLADAVPSATSVVATWVAPTDTGGSPITGYDVKFRRVTNQEWTTVPTAGAGTSVTIPGLSPHARYEINVAALNAVGASTAGRHEVVTESGPDTPPGAPTLRTLAPGAGGVDVGWDAPLGDGGSPITGYQVEFKPQSGTTWSTYSSSGAGTSAHLTGLASGTAYDVRVRAVNEVGTGIASGIGSTAAGSGETANPSPSPSPSTSSGPPAAGTAGNPAAVAGVKVLGKAKRSTKALNVSFTAIGASSSVISGMVAVYDGSRFLGLFDVVAGKVSVKVRKLKKGKHKLTFVLAPSDTSQGGTFKATLKVR